MVRFEVWNDLFPAAGGGACDVVPRVMRAAFVEEWQSRPAEARQHAERLRGEVMTSLQQGRAHELVPFTGQTAGLIHDVLPTAEIVRRVVAEAEDALAGTARHRS